jgi:hypothetical protein
MIIDNTYFTQDIYVPHAKPSVTDTVTGVSEDIVDFINEYSTECLLKCLGYKLFKDFSAELDSTKPSGLKDEADVKWNALLNGKEYTNSNGDLVYWKGIRYKDTPTSTTYKSFLAYYTYFFYERNDDTTRSSTGHSQEEAKNAIRVSAAPKVITAWNKFVKMVQGEICLPTVYDKGSGIGIDYFSESQNVSLYKFIQDSNILVPNTYEGFIGKTWYKINQFGI